MEVIAPAVEPKETEIKEFDPNTAALMEMVEETKALVIKDADDAEGYKLVDTARKNLKKTRTKIVAIGENLREEAIKRQRAVLAEQKRLIAIIEPEEKRLEEMQDAIDLELLKRKRKELMPAREERLRGIECPAWNEETVLEMDEAAFEVFFNKEYAAFLARKEEAMRQAEAAREAEAAAEREKVEAAATAEREKQEALLRAEREKADAEIAAERAKIEVEKQAALEVAAAKAEQLRVEEERLAEEKRKHEEEVRLEAARKEAAETARLEAEEKDAREKREAAAKMERERIERERDAKYQAWLNKNGCMNSNDENFVVNIHRDVLGTPVSADLFKKVDSIKF